MSYKVMLIASNGEEWMEDEVFDTEEEAEDYALECLGNYSTGMETLNMSNPGDYPLDDDDGLDYEIIEV